MNESHISWTDYTGGPHLSCTEVSPGCANCYARTLMERRHGPILRRAYRMAGLADWETRPLWGKTAPRVMTKGFWTKARQLNTIAAKEGKRLRMFPSLIDWLDDMPAGVMDQEGQWMQRAEVMARFLAMIHATPHLDWLLLTKRPENWEKSMSEALSLTTVDFKTGDKGPVFEMVNEWAFGHPPPNVWVGVSVENQRWAAIRIPELLQIPAKVRFLSIEPQLGLVDLRWIVDDDNNALDALTGDWGIEGRGHTGPSEKRVHWVICGGESGSNRRPFEVEWAQLLADQCAAAGVAFHMKQDSAMQPGQQGRIPAKLWERKEFPVS